MVGVIVGVSVGCVGVRVAVGVGVSVTVGINVAVNLGVKLTIGASVFVGIRPVGVAASCAPGLALHPASATSAASIKLTAFSLRDNEEVPPRPLAGKIT